MLKGGRRVENVFILDRREVLGVYGVSRLDFNIADIEDVIAVPRSASLPEFEAAHWLRLDGVGTPV